MKKVFLFVVVLLFLWSAIPTYSFERVTNFASCVSVYDFESSGDTLYVACSGGLFIYKKSASSGYLVPNTNSSPDPYITALALPSNHVLWTGSNQGYLSKRPQPGNDNSTTTGTSFFSTNWSIRDIEVYGKYLFIASDKGLSIFNTEKEFSEKNATKFGSLPSTQINTIKIFKDTLWAGFNVGFAKLYLKSIDSINSINIFDPGIWSTTETITPVNSFVYQNGCKPFSGVADIFRGSVLHSVDSLLYLDDTEIANLQSTITAIKVINDNECWIGTKDNYFLRWDGNSFYRIEIPGLTMSKINKVYTDRSGKIWFMPYMLGDGAPWFVGIGSFANGQWQLYNPQNYPTVGSIGGDPDNRAIIQTKDNRVWFGTSGGQIKTYTPQNDSWIMYRVHQDNDSGFSSGTDLQGWGKVDAFAIDSSGYLWISSWRNHKGCLICYDYRFDPDQSQKDPVKAHFRRFFPQNDTNYATNYTSLDVNKDGTIIAGSDSGKVIVFSHNGSPLTDKIKIIKSFTIPGGPKVNDIVTTSDNLTRLATINGMFIYNPIKNDYSKSEDFDKNVTSLEVENDQMLWIGTSDQGLIRYNITDSTKTIYTTTQGLISNDITDISVNKKTGYLWIATEIGFSMLDLGARLDQKITPSDIQIFPNPYSKTKNGSKPINLRNIPLNSKVVIYAIDGQKIAIPTLEKTETNGLSYTWKPSSSIVPGTYFVSIGNQSQSRAKVLLIAP